MVNVEGNHPQMAELFRLVKYYNLPRSMVYLYIYLHDWVIYVGQMLVNIYTSTMEHLGM